MKIGDLFYETWHYILGTAERIAKGDGKVSICCDIYEDNVPMRELLLSYGYQFTAIRLGRQHLHGPQLRRQRAEDA
ncbi:hypothetical protein, partial [Eggerthella lenta]|uniref:hypothetical protein n=1 Tax=Eggerthella lenta TaxID=84112 RepID=UPI00210E1644